MTTLPATDLLSPRSAARGLVTGDQRLDGLLTHAASEPGALLAAARAAAGRRLDRPALVETLLAGLAELDAPDEARAAARRLSDPATVVVVTGQQPGLLGGPLMVVVKALAAAAVARRLESEGVPAVPVFWHASEDHDHGEADHVGWPSVGGESPAGPQRLRLPLPEDARVLSAVPVPAEAAELVERVRALMPTGPGRELASEVLAPRSGESFGTWTGRLLARVLGPHGIVVVEPHRLRHLAVAVAREELAAPGALFASIESAQARVTAAGYDPPLALRRPELLFHVERPAGRRRAVSTADAPLEEWQRRLEADPGAFSWNVAARVLAQDVAFPVAAQICGPSELGYVALLREAHERLGVPQPAAMLRPGVTLLDRAAARACKKMGVAVADVIGKGREALPPVPLSAEASLQVLTEALEGLPVGESPGSRRRRSELLRQAGLFEDALRREVEEADATRTQRTRTLLDGLRPFDRPMERALSFLPWFARSGDAFAARLLDRLGTGAPGHHVISSEDL